MEYTEKMSSLDGRRLGKRSPLLDVHKGDRLYQFILSAP